MDSTWLPPWAEDVSGLLPVREGASKSKATEKMARSFRVALWSVEKGGG